MHLIKPDKEKAYKLFNYYKPIMKPKIKITTLFGLSSSYVLLFYWAMNNSNGPSKTLNSLHIMEPTSSPKSQQLFGKLATELLTNLECQL